MRAEPLPPGERVADYQLRQLFSWLRHVVVFHAYGLFTFRVLGVALGHGRTGLD
jgi:hypothetical protein